jgi:hypothetical protein
VVVIRGRVRGRSRERGRLFGLAIMQKNRKIRPGPRLTITFTATSTFTSVEPRLESQEGVLGIRDELLENIDGAGFLWFVEFVDRPQEFFQEWTCLGIRGIHWIDA